MSQRIPTSPKLQLTWDQFNILRPLYEPLYELSDISSIMHQKHTISVKSKTGKGFSLDLKITSGEEFITIFFRYNPFFIFIV